MIELVKDYLKSIEFYLDDEILSVEPFVADGEQQFEIWVKNMWVEPGKSEVYVSISELLVFIYNKN